VSAALSQLATEVRSKNAGPFWLTFDVFFPDRHSFARAVESSLTDSNALGGLFDLPPENVRVFILGNLLAIKISIPRPRVQGSAGDPDSHGGQQFVPLLDLQIP
jgi:hypothetical protein